MMVADALRQAFEQREEQMAALLAERARDLARREEDEPAQPQFQVLTLSGAVGRWALPVAAAARVEPLGGVLALPDPPAPVLGLALLAGRRCLLMDPEVVLAGAPCRSCARPGHAVLLRDHPLALAVDRVEAVLWLPRPPEGARVLADGSLLMELGRLVTAATRGGGR